MPIQPCITIYMNEELKKKIQSEASESYLDMSSFIRLVLVNYLKQNKGVSSQDE